MKPPNSNPSRPRCPDPLWRSSQIRRTPPARRGSGCGRRTLAWLTGLGPLLAALLLPAAERPLTYDVLAEISRFLPGRITDARLNGSSAWVGFDTNVVQEIEWGPVFARPSRTFQLPHASLQLAQYRRTLMATDLRTAFSLFDLDSPDGRRRTLELPAPATQIDFVNDSLFIATSDGGLLRIEDPANAPFPWVPKVVVPSDPAAGKTNIVSRFIASRTLLVYTRNRRDVKSGVIEAATFPMNPATGQPPEPDSWTPVPGTLTPAFLANGYGYFWYDDGASPGTHYLAPADLADPMHPTFLPPFPFGTRTAGDPRPPRALLVSARTVLDSEGTLWDLPNPAQRTRLGRIPIHPRLPVAASTNGLIQFGTDFIGPEGVHHFTFNRSLLEATRTAFYGERPAFPLGVDGDFAYFASGTSATLPELAGPIAIYTGLSSNRPVPYAWMSRPANDPPPGRTPSNRVADYLWAFEDHNDGRRVTTFQGGLDGRLHFIGSTVRLISMFLSEKLAVTPTQATFSGELSRYEVVVENGVPDIRPIAGKPSLSPLHAPATSHVAREIEGLNLWDTPGGVLLRRSSETNAVVFLPATHALLIPGGRGVARWPDGSLRLLGFRSAATYATPVAGVTTSFPSPLNLTQGPPRFARGPDGTMKAVAEANGELRLYSSCDRAFGFELSGLRSPGGGASPTFTLGLVRSDRYEGDLLVGIAGDQLKVLGLGAPSPGAVLAAINRIEGANARFLSVDEGCSATPVLRALAARGPRVELVEVGVRNPTLPTLRRLADLGPTNGFSPSLVASGCAGPYLVHWGDRLLRITDSAAEGIAVTAYPLPMSTGQILSWGEHLILCAGHRIETATLSPGQAGRDAALEFLDLLPLPEGLVRAYPCGNRLVLIDRDEGARVVEVTPAGRCLSSERLTQGRFSGAFWDGDRILLLGRNHELHSISAWGSPWVKFGTCHGLQVVGSEVILGFTGDAGAGLSVEVFGPTPAWLEAGRLRLDETGRGSLRLPRREAGFALYRARVND